MINLLESTPAGTVQSFFPNTLAVNTLVGDTMLQMGDGVLDVRSTYQEIVDGINDIFIEYYRQNPLP
jgi:hypothetical protein